MCGIPQKAAAARFLALLNEVLNKVIHRQAGRLQLFSRIQNLARKLKFYFNFDGFAVCSMCTVMRPRAASIYLIHTAA
ncbi:hypothetical protein AYM40_20015 [Paraburkholderia phytofirmans OLGA172]|uniref:Transposase DDE domain-containing protein n=1 Tax=Paraburkholderia phytofirmans OLGA172 TaxID=1417228 RepID=A0A161I797_9BURK|nr:hypothetical protein AYM40_20015 [Paraburkholderia phytofirmans OLGA172]